jgi:UDP-N-acetylmuramoyl-L-alanyl-D-glutamate--2,6-diaminopimelate ligase
MGCGGDRDKTKRPLMGMEAASGGDFVVITSDNPRSEDPIDIIHQIEEGVRGYGFRKVSNNPAEPIIKKGSYVVISDRGEAIKWAISKFGLRDTLLIAGKGHETYQEIQGIRYPLDDRVIALEESRKLNPWINGIQTPELTLRKVKA